MDVCGGPHIRAQLSEQRDLFGNHEKDWPVSRKHSVTVSEIGIEPKHVGGGDPTRFTLDEFNARLAVAGMKPMTMDEIRQNAVAA